MTETIVLGGGCFWCTEAVFDRVRGIVDLESGYANGHLDHPSYEAICTGQTGHAEVVKLEYDSDVIGLRDLLLIFLQPMTPPRLTARVTTWARSTAVPSSPRMQNRPRWRLS